MKVVLDTNVVVSALLFPKGQPSWLRDLWTTDRIVPLVCHETVRELIRVLAYPKFKLGEEDIHALLAAYLPLTQTVAIIDDLGPALPLCRDPQDQIFLKLDFVGKAEVLVTGDLVLQDLTGQVPFAIDAPAAFRERFKNRLA